MRAPPLVTAVTTTILLAAVVSCRDATEPTRAAPRTASAAFDTYLKVDGVDNGQLRGHEGEVDFGHFQVVFYAQSSCLAAGVCTPPGPCEGRTLTGTPVGYTALGICARVFNPGGETFTSGSLLQVGTTDAATVLALGAPGAFPPNPCRSYTVQGVVYVADAVASRMRAFPGSYRLSFATVDQPTSALSGALDGSTTGAVGPLGETDTWFASDRCTVDVTAR